MLTNTDTTTTATPKKIIILWDLHGVLFIKSVPAILKTLWHIHQKTRCVFELIHALFCTKAFFKLCKLIYNFHGVSQAYIDCFLPYKHLHTQLMLVICRLYTPQPDTRAILKKLHTYNPHTLSSTTNTHTTTNFDTKTPIITHYILSNIGPDALLLMQKLYPEYFVYFTSQTNLINPPGTPEDLWVWKPQAHAYTQALEKVTHVSTPAPHIPQTFLPEQQAFMIFVDDKKKNIQAAQKYQKNILTSIQFYNAQQTERAILNLLKNGS